MGNLCFKFPHSLSKNSSDSSPSLIFYKTNELLPTNDTSPTLQKVTNTTVTEYTSSSLSKSSSPSSSNKLLQYPKPSIIDHYLLIWLTLDVNEHQDYLKQLQHSFHCFRLFTNIDDFFAFIVQVKTEKLFLILSDTIADKTLSVIHKISPLVSIYILSDHQSNDQQWINQYEKIQGIYTDIKPICENFKQMIYLSENDIVSIEIINSSQIVRQYLLKQLLLVEINSNDQFKKDFIHFIRKEYGEELNIINEFDENYQSSNSIWWYTRKCFLYSMINQAFRTENFKLLFQMGYIIRDLHEKVEQLQIDSDNTSPLIVYRGQGITKNQLELIQKNSDGLISFKGFLWTNSDRTISLNFARLARNNPDFYGVLYRIEINSIKKYVSLEKLSYYLNSETDYLFSIYSIFRINAIKQIEDNLWEIHLILILENDQLLKDNSQSINHIKGEAIWEKFGFYLIKLKEIDKAKEFYRTLLDLNLINNPEKLALINEQLAQIYQKQNDLNNSLLYYKKSLKDHSNTSSPNDSNLFDIYFNIGRILYQQNQFHDALKYFKYALNLGLYSSPIDHLQLSIIYQHVADIYDQQGLCVEAIENYQSCLENQLNHIPLDHLAIANTYNKIGEIFYSVEDYTTAHSYFEKTLKIQKKTLSPNHSILAITNYNIAMALEGLQQYKEAIEYASRALNIARHSFGSNHKNVQLYEEYLDQLRQKTSIGVIPNGSVYG